MRPDQIVQARRLRQKQTGADLAHREVAKAIARGDLLPADQCTCADCGDAAEVYDHRDYAAPLEVDPVCYSCNVRRGKAKPNPETFEQYRTVVIEADAGWKARLEEPSIVPFRAIEECETFRDAVLVAWDLRRERGMTRASLAERVGIHGPHVTDVLSGGPSKGKRSLNPDQIDDFEWAVGNRAVTQYLLFKAGISLILEPVRSNPTTDKTRGAA